jgi:hypothetical protein
LTGMKIEELVSGKGGQESVDLEGLSVPVAGLRTLSEEGYTNLRVYKENKTVSLWGKSCSACLTLEQLQERVKSE